MATKYVNLNKWLNSHEVSIDSLGSENVMDACYDALYDELKEEAIDEFISNNSNEIAWQLAGDLPEINIEEFALVLQHIITKKQEDWRILISDNFDPKEGYSNFFDEHYDEFVEWLKAHNYEVPEDPDKLEEKYLGSDVDIFLQFASEILCNIDRYSIDNIIPVCALEKLPVDEIAEAFEDDIEEYLEGNIHNYTDEGWFRDWLEENFDIDSEMSDYITPDDYYPLWNYAWEFPASYSAEELNKEMDGIGLIFFELNGVVYVSLGTVGMSMMPSLYYAYDVYSDLYIDPEEIAQDIISHGVGYYKSVIGRDRLIELTERIGYDLKELDRISKENYEEFDRMLESLKKEVSEGKMDRFEAAIIGMMKINEKPDVSGAKSSS